MREYGKYGRLERDAVSYAGARTINHAAGLVPVFLTPSSSPSLPPRRGCLSRVRSRRECVVSVTSVYIPQAAASRRRIYNLVFLFLGDSIPRNGSRDGAAVPQRVQLPPKLGESSLFSLHTVVGNLAEFFVADCCWRGASPFVYLPFVVVYLRGWVLSGAYSAADSHFAIFDF